MSKSRSSFSASEKLSIINEADQFGVKAVLEGYRVNQEFTHVATPEENAYIEALHSNIRAL